MTEQDRFLLSEIQGEFEQQSSSLSQCNTGEHHLNDLGEQFLVSSESDSKYVLENIGLFQKNCRAVVTETQDQEAGICSLSTERKNGIDSNEVNASNTHKEDGSTESNREKSQDLGALGCRERENNLVENHKNNSNNMNSKSLNQENGRKAAEELTFCESFCTDYNKSSNDIPDGPIKLEVDVIQSREGCEPLVENNKPSSGSGNSESITEESSKQSKFNCVMCDNHFLDLIQLESHVKSHSEVLHFSILLKKVVSNYFISLDNKYIRSSYT